jgi:hypothetical protein
MTRRKNNRNSGEYHKPNIWGMLRDIGVSSLNKGQFPIAIAGAIIIILIIKMPSEDASKLIFDLLGLLLSTHIIGWILAFVLSIGWFLHVKSNRRIHTEEMRRVTDEKNRLQETLLNKKLTSSN